MLKEQYRVLEINLKNSEILLEERDASLQQKERDILGLKSKQSTLENFKYVLNHRIQMLSKEKGPIAGKCTLILEFEFVYNFCRPTFFLFLVLFFNFFFSVALLTLLLFTCFTCTEHIGALEKHIREMYRELVVEFNIKKDTTMRLEDALMKVKGQSNEIRG